MLSLLFLKKADFLTLHYIHPLSAFLIYHGEVSTCLATLHPREGVIMVSLVSFPLAPSAAADPTSPRVDVKKMMELLTLSSTPGAKPTSEQIREAHSLAKIIINDPTRDPASAQALLKLAYHGDEGKRNLLNDLNDISRNLSVLNRKTEFVRFIPIVLTEIWIRAKNKDIDLSNFNVSSKKLGNITDINSDSGNSILYSFMNFLWQVYANEKFTPLKSESAYALVLIGAASTHFSNKNVIFDAIDNSKLHNLYYELGRFWAGFSNKAEKSKENFEFLSETLNDRDDQRAPTALTFIDAIASDLISKSPKPSNFPQTVPTGHALVVEQRRQKEMNKKVQATVPATLTLDELAETPKTPDALATPAIAALPPPPKPETQVVSLAPQPKPVAPAPAPVQAKPIVPAAESVVAAAVTPNEKPISDKIRSHVPPFGIDEYTSDTPNTTKPVEKPAVALAAPAVAAKPAPTSVVTASVEAKPYGPPFPVQTATLPKPEQDKPVANALNILPAANKTSSNVSPHLNLGYERTEYQDLTTRRAIAQVGLKTRKVTVYLEGGYVNANTSTPKTEAPAFYPFTPLSTNKDIELTQQNLYGLAQLDITDPDDPSYKTNIDKLKKYSLPTETLSVVLNGAEQKIKYDPLLFTGELPTLSATGGTVGVGADYQINRQWSIAAKVNVDILSVTTQGGTTCNDTSLVAQLRASALDIQARIDEIRAQINDPKITSSNIKDKQKSIAALHTAMAALTTAVQNHNNIANQINQQAVALSCKENPIQTDTKINYGGSVSARYNNPEKRLSSADLGLVYQNQFGMHFVDLRLSGTVDLVKGSRFNLGITADTQLLVLKRDEEKQLFLNAAAGPRIAIKNALELLLQVGTSANLSAGYLGWNIIGSIRVTSPNLKTEAKHEHSLARDQTTVSVSN